MNEELILYYANLLILQYRNKVKAPAHIAAIMEQAIFLELIRDVENGYDIETAVGVQQDVLAKYVGAKRVSSAVDFSRTFFGFVDYVESQPYINVTGLIDYSNNSPVDSQFLSYRLINAYILTDQELKIIIKLKIAQNNSNHSTKEVDDIIQEFFPNTAIFNDNFNMTGSYIFDESERRIIEIAIGEKAIPKPAAVGFTVTYTPDINNIFGMLNYNNDIPSDFTQGLLDYADDSFGGWLEY